MSEYRQDLITGQWVIMASGRAVRPDTFVPKRKTGQAGKAHRENCPFCYGNEDQTLPEVSAWRNGGGPDTPGWQVRVVPNKFPAVEPGAGLDTWCRDGIYPGMNGYGVHEVIIETPVHNRHPGSLPVPHMETVLTSYLHRFRELSPNENIKYVQVFRNHLKEAGASIEHPHSQLVGLPFIPPQVQREIDGSRRHYLDRKSCPYCFMLKEELRIDKRVIYESDFFVALMPYASRMPFETWIMPKKHCSSFEKISSGEGLDLAVALTAVLNRFAVSLYDPPYNLYLHTAPLRSEDLPAYHWHVEIVPRLNVMAGFEMGSGVHINVTVPEEAAGFMKI